MRIFLRILSCVFATLLAVLSLVFLAIEFRALFAGDLSLAQNVASAVVSALSRIIMFLLFILYAVTVFLGRKKTRNPAWFLTLGFVCLCASAISFCFYEWYLSLALILLTGLSYLSGADAAIRKV